MGVLNLQINELTDTPPVFFTSSGAIYAPSPAPTATFLGDDGSSASWTFTQLGSGTTARFYVHNFTQAAKISGALVYATTDASADCLQFQDSIIVGSDALQGIATVLARLGAFTGTGVNTVLGFLKALGSKSASTPTDMGGTYDAATDSLEAINDNLATVQNVVDGAWDEPIADHLDAGSTGEALDNAASGASDLLSSPVPNGYAVGTAGYNLGLLPTIEAQTSLITADNVAIAVPVDPDNLALTLYNDTSYLPASGVTLPTWTNSAWTVYGLTTATVNFYWIDKNSIIDTPLGTMVVDSATSIHLTVAHTDVFTLPLGLGVMGYKIVAVLDVAHGSEEVQLVNAALSHLNYVQFPPEPNTQP